MSHFRKLGAGMRRSLWCSALGLLALTSQGIAQSDSVPSGPPPHFVTDSGTLIDTSRMAALQRRVSLDLADVPINTAVLAIMDQAKLWLLYRGEAIPADRRVSVQAKEITVASALVQVLRNTGVDVVSAPGGWLTLTKCTHRPDVAAKNGSGAITGRITDHSTDTPLAGATVVVEGTQFSTSSNTDGRYRIDGVPFGKYSVMARYIGYAASSDTVSVGLSSGVENFALTPSAQPLDQVVVTGTLVPTEVRALPTPITVISADEIRQQHVMRLNQLFRGQVAGAFGWDRPADDHYNIINVRGVTSFSTRAIKTYVDGIELADPQFTALIDPNTIERIEMTRGPQASTMYGSDALGGVLQIFTKKGKLGLIHPEAEITAGGSLIGKNDGSGAALRLDDAVTLRGGEQHTRYQASAYYRHDGEWTPSYHNTNWSVAASAENVQGRLTSRISALFGRKSFDRPWLTTLRDSGYAFFSVPPFQTIDLQTQTFGTSFVYEPTPWWRHELTLGYDRWAFGLTQTERRLSTPDDTLLQVIMNQSGKASIFYFTAVNARLARSVGTTLTAGFNYYRLDGSNTSSPSTVINVGTLTGPSTILRLPSSNTGYFAQLQVNLAETAFLTTGLRAERSPGFGRDVGTVVSPRFGGAYVHPVGPVLMKLRTAYGESIRAPDPSQNQALIDANFMHLYNSRLRPERQRGIDGGIDLYWGHRIAFSATYYNQSAIDLIDQVVSGNAENSEPVQTQAQNVGKIKNHGWEFEAQYLPNRWQMSGTLSIARSRAQQLDPLYSGDYRVGDRLFDVPNYSTGLAIAYSMGSHTALHGGMTSVGSWIDWDFITYFGVLFGGLPARQSNRNYWITYPGFTKFRIGLEQRIWKDVTGMFDVENITNRHAFESTNIDILSPRTFTLTLRASY